MLVAKIQVSGVSANVVCRKTIPSGIIGAQIEIDYAAGIWQGLRKTVVFRSAFTKDVITDDNVVTIPAEVVSKPNVVLYVGVYGVDSDGKLAIPTLWAKLGVIWDATDPSGDESTNPALPVWAEILDKANTAEHIAQSLRQDAEAGRFDGAPGADGHTPEKGVDYFTADEVAEIEAGAAEKLKPELSKVKDDLSQIEELNYLKNQCDNSQPLESGYISYLAGTVLPHASYKHTDFIPVNAGTLYFVRGPLYSHFAFYNAKNEGRYVTNTKGNDIRLFDGGIIKGFSDNDNCYYFVSPISGYVRFSTTYNFVLLIAVESLDSDTSSVDINDHDKYPQYVVNGIAELEESIADVSSRVDSLDDMKDSVDYVYGKFIDTSNLANPEEFQTGIIDNTNKLWTDSTNYSTCGYIFLRAGEQITSNYKFKRNIAVNMNKTTVVSGSYAEEVNSYTATEDCWFRGSIFTGGKYEYKKTSWMISYGSESKDFVPYRKETEYEEKRKNIRILASGGIMGFYENMLEAYEHKNCDVYVEKGIYSFTNDLIDSIRANGKRGIPIGNGCRYYFESGAFIYCEYTGENKSDVCNMFSPLDSWNVGTDFEIENLHLVSKNTVYALHDESNGATNNVRHRYKNCYIELDNTGIPDETTYISKALGGGLGQFTDICIENCVFIGTNPYNPNSVGNDASYHGPNNSDVSHNRITVVNSWFKGNFRTSNLGTETDVKCDITYSGCSSSSPVSFPDNWNAKAFCNEVRS